MSNPWTGEVAITLNGVTHQARLSLGALAELEEKIPDHDLVALMQRFESGAFNARDIVAVLVAGLRGGGWDGGVHDLTQANIDGGPLAAAKIAARLLVRAFTPPVDDAR